MLTFLHLSDLHITTSDAGTQFDLDGKIREALLNDLGKDGRTNFDAILVTGDIAYHGRADEFARAKVWLENVRAATNSSPEALFVVPGNHDVNQARVDKDSSLWELHQSLRRPSSDEDRHTNLAKKLHDPFDFLTAMTEYRSFAGEYNCPTTANELAWVQVLNGDHLLEDGTAVRFYGLNSAIISDGEDKKANLYLSELQFSHFDAKPNYVNVVLCHHPHGWLLDGNSVNDHLRTQAHVVLCGHDHNVRCYKEGGSMRVFAGATHPARLEAGWEPCYHVLRLSVPAASKRELIATVETRIWRPKDNLFGPYTQSNGSNLHEERIVLPEWSDHDVGIHRNSHSKPPKTSVSACFSPDPMPPIPSDDTLSAAKRKLIVHFFRLGTVIRFQVVIDAGVWEEGDDAFSGQDRWARVFARAETSGRLDLLWDAVASKDNTLAGQPNPFTTLAR